MSEYTIYEYQHRAAQTSTFAKVWVAGFEGRQAREMRNDRFCMACLGLVGELWEVEEAYDGGKRQLFLEETGDFWWYVAELATTLGADLSYNFEPYFEVSGHTKRATLYRSVRRSVAWFAEQAKKNVFHNKQLPENIIQDVYLLRNRAATYFRQQRVDLPQVWFANIQKLETRHNIKTVAP